MKLVFLIFLILALASSASPPERRSIQVTTTPQTVHFQASSVNETVQDVFTFDLTLSRAVSEILSGAFQYTKDNQSSSEFHFQVVGLLEINSTMIDGYRGDLNTIIGSYPGSVEADWLDWVDESKIVNGIRVISYSASTKDRVFVVRVYIAEETVEDGKISVGPNNVKIDFEVHSFPHEDPDARIAIQAKVQSGQQSHNSGAQAIADFTLAFGGANDSPYSTLSWEPTATAPVDEVSIISYSPQVTAANEFDLFWTFHTAAQPTSIIWDPRIGLDYSDVPSAEFCFASVCGIGAIFIVVGIILGVLLLVGIILFAIFKRRQGYDSIDNNTSYV